MSLFDQLVDEALRSRADLGTLRPVVEKELLHHDILREMGRFLSGGCHFQGRGYLFRSPIIGGAGRFVA